MIDYRRVLRLFPLLALGFCSCAVFTPRYDRSLDAMARATKSYYATHGGEFPADFATLRAYAATQGIRFDTSPFDRLSIERTPHYFIFHFSVRHSPRGGDLVLYKNYKAAGTGAADSTR